MEPLELKKNLLYLKAAYSTCFLTLLHVQKTLLLFINVWCMYIGNLREDDLDMSVWYADKELTWPISRIWTEQAGQIKDVLHRIKSTRRKTIFG